MSYVRTSPEARQCPPGNAMPWPRGSRTTEVPIASRRVTARVPVANMRARRLVEGAGFVLEGLVRSAGPDGGDVLIYGMLKEECRWVSSQPRPRAGERMRYAA